jgi:hypothetical protein
LNVDARRPDVGISEQPGSPNNIPNAAIA